MTHENGNILNKCQEFKDQIKHLEAKSQVQKEKTNTMMAKVKEDMSHGFVEQTSKLNTQISFLTRKHEIEMQEKDHSIKVMRGDLSY
jgi:hypothetical protein